jgi:hypothetical protein
MPFVPFSLLNIVGAAFSRENKKPGLAGKAGFFGF